jgi:hypothetical protein
MATAIETTEQTRSNVPALTPEGERFALRQRQAKMFAMSPLVPDHLRKGPAEQAIANCWIALTLAEAMGEVPLIVMQNIHIVNGKAGFASQYMIARANSSGIFKGRIDWRIDRTDANNLSVTAYAILKETEQEVAVTCDMKMAKAEGWTKNAKYTTMPEVMLRYRSAAFLVRFYAPDVMLGYQTSEEIEDVAVAAQERPALTSDMLLNQSRPQETVDQVTGEVVDQLQREQEERDHNGGYTIAEDVTHGEPEDPDEERTVEDEQPSQVNDEAVVEPVTEEAHPAQPKCDEILGEIEGAAAIIDINSIVSRHREDIEAMPDEMQIKIEIAADRRKNAIRAEREKASA